MGGFCRRGASDGLVASRRRVAAVGTVVMAAGLALAVPAPAAAHHGNATCASPGDGAPVFGDWTFPSMWRSTVGSGNVDATLEGVVGPFQSEFFPNGGHQGEDVFPLPGYQPSGSRLAVAPASGEVAVAAHEPLPGWRVTIHHPTAYGEFRVNMFHLHDNPANYGIVQGQQVDQGWIVGKVGNTGNAVGRSPHIHFELRHLQLGLIYCPLETLEATYSAPGMVNHPNRSQKFVDAYERFGGQFPSSLLGAPNGVCHPGQSSCGPNRVHGWNQVWVQTFLGGFGEW
jgi:murein DD-endopeptidase MepM/ murein hydrolase activator NlpD